MSKEIPKVYDPREVEPRWYAHWMKNGFFHAEVNPERPMFSIVIPPPNVTGALHIGHAYNNTVQDIYSRFKRMQGYEMLWTPGTDHAGIATQTVVEKQLKAEGKDRRQMGRETFLAEVWGHKATYRDRIVGQLQKMGCSCDWDREWFTMDDRLSRGVIEVFVHFYRKGWIYKGNYIVNWCPFSQSAISDEEVDYREVQGKLWHFRYPVKDSNEFVVVATTRPETMLGDTAVAVHPEDARYRHLVGKRVILPLVGREIPIIADTYVDREFGTGAVKVTPSHDPNDFDMGRRHDLEFVNIMNPDATLNTNVPTPFQGLDRFVARKKVVEAIDKLGLLERVEDHVNRVGYSQRGNVPIEPLISDQWFLKMSELAKPALNAVLDGRITFHPEKWIKTYEHWMRHIRDWCISRQLWWGHRIPAYYAPNGDCAVAATPDEALEELRKKHPTLRRENLRQDEDVLDTWFSSWLVPFSSLGWPEQTKELKYFYPTSLLVTGPDIIFFWVARMIMAGMEFMNEVPFRSVYFNGIVRDEQGRKMSKSLGNGIDPIEVIEEYSADALRFTLVDLSAEGQDIHLGKRHFEQGRNFSNKVWNAYRFLGMHMASIPAAAPRKPDAASIHHLADRWILSRYHRAVRGITEGLEKFRLHEAMDSVYHFFWADYCDWYLELIKSRLYGSDEKERQATLSTALYVMEGIVKLLHPITPFITEEIWQQLDRRRPDESVMKAAWETVDETLIDPDAERDFELLRQMVVAVRNIRSEMNINPAQKTRLLIKTSDADTIAVIQHNRPFILDLARTESVEAGDAVVRPDKAASAVVGKVELFVPMEGVIDLEVERARLSKEIQRLESQIDSIDRKLRNEDFISRAPASVIDKERSKRQSFFEAAEKLKSNLSRLT
jgi:valyl-tRNA synthetase